MTTINSVQAPTFDTGPLSWVMAEVAEALARSRTALQEAATRPADEQATLLQHAKTHLHQAHGALQMVDVDGAGLFAEAAEQVLERFQDGTLECDPPHAAILADGYQAVTEYLEQLLLGAPQQAVRLFPYYRAILALLGAERIHPADLFYPNLTEPVTLPDPAGAVPHAGAARTQDARLAQYAAARQHFEKALLPFLRGADQAAQTLDAGALYQAISAVAGEQHEAGARTFWSAMQGFAELVADGQLGCDLYVKQLFGLINLQIRRLSQGSADLPEGMLRDALFFIAGAQNPPPLAQQLRHAYRLDGMVPADYETKRYGQIDPAALAAARDGLAQAKAVWARVAEDDIDAALEAEFGQALQHMAGASEQLGVPALTQVLRQLGLAARAPLAVKRGPQFGLELAAALLFVEHGLDQIRRLPDDFAAHARTVGVRLQQLLAGHVLPEAPQWQGDLAHQIDQGRTVSVLAGEMKAGLRQVEKLLDEYHVDPAKRPSLTQIDPLLHQLQGALAILDQDHAMRAARHVREAVRQLAEAGGDPAPAAEPQALQDIAQNVGALGFFIDMLAQNFDAASERFRFDATRGLFGALALDALAKPAHPVAPARLDVPDMPAEAAGEPGVNQAAARPEPVVAADAAVEAELLEIFISEAQEVLAFVAATLPAARAERGSVDQLTMLRRSFHTLKGSGRMVGLTQFADAAASVERVMNHWLAEALGPSEALFALLEWAARDMSAWVQGLCATGASSRTADALVMAAGRVQAGAPFEIDASATEPAPQAAAVAAVEAEPADQVKRVGALEIALPLYDIYLAEADELVRVLHRDFSAWRHGPRRPVSVEALHAAHTLTGSSGTVGFSALRELAHALEMCLEALVPPAPLLELAQHDVIELTQQRMAHMLESFGIGELAPPQPALVAQLQQLRLQLLQTAVAAPAPKADETPAPEDAVTDVVSEVVAEVVPEVVIEVVPEVVTEVVTDAARDAVVGAAPDAAPDAAPAAVADGVADGMADGMADPAPARIVSDDLDPDLLPVFLEEGSDLLPRIGQALRAWQHNPADGGQVQMLLRLLHTVKGSARMAGAMRLGQHAHDIETYIQRMAPAGSATAPALEQLLGHYDHALLLFEQLQRPAGAGASMPAAVDTGDTADTIAGVAGGASAAPAIPASEEAAPSANVALVRVRADILDRLVNQAGEVSIARSKLENKVGSLRSSLFDFSESLARLRRQLREVEMQAESQIASRMAIAGEREFDPLEFDRFTRLQELTRMMAESVNDVASFHESLGRTVEHATDDLAVQARLTRDLQRDLMQVRMVPFASIGERLFRVARQSAKEVDKRVNLEIRGGAVEVDRSVLEQMVAPFEHLVRNAIVHGIEPQAARAAGAKSEMGQLLVQVSQQGNEVAIEFIDDGAGLDLPRIRTKARASGLLAPGAKASDAQLADLIFAAGLSTSDQVTELAGRGVGLDVVRTEAQALGGRVEVVSMPGKGARFTIHLPLTLAVTQVVLIAAAGATYALPATLVEQVQQVKPAALAAAHATGTLAWQGQQLKLHYLPSLLGGPQASALAQRSCPVLILRNGIERLALQVDEVTGNREVVVKNIGPQLARMSGIAGATVLGSGEIVLILNPVALARSHRPGLHPAAVADAAPIRRRDLRIMVVDDSLTVRRVTQRLLEREGYQVALAKDGVDALEQLASALPDLMLVDIEMPRMDGFDLTRNLRGDPRTSAIPIIMITSRSADKHRNYALQLGVNAYFGKPFQEPALLAAIAGLMQVAPA
jgi:chemosensory pili system protein ChpA (sensor histidine kinase/response regulator)